MLTAILILAAVVLTAVIVGAVIGAVNGNVGLTIWVAFGGLGDLLRALVWVLAELAKAAGGSSD